MRVRIVEEVGDFLAACHRWLAENPVEHNLLLSLAEVNRRAPARSRWVWQADDSLGMAALAQCPIGFRAVLTPLSRREARAWAAAVAAAGLPLPGVIGEAATASSFAGEWASCRSVGARPLEGQRLYHFGGQGSLDVAPLGVLRPAGHEDVVVLAKMWSNADAETGAVRPTGHDYQTEVREHCEAGLGWVWEHAGRVRSMCFASTPAAGVVRLRGVYTEPDDRGRGYASGMVAAVSEQLSADDLGIVLYTQLTNPASDRIYQQIGYQVVSEVLCYDFDVDDG